VSHYLTDYAEARSYQPSPSAAALVHQRIKFKLAVLVYKSYRA